MIEVVEVDDADATENGPVRRSIEGWSGEYETTTVIHTVPTAGGAMVIDHIRAEKCPACADVLFTPESVRPIERRLTALANS